MVGSAARHVSHGRRRGRPGIVVAVVLLALAAAFQGSENERATSASVARAPRISQTTGSLLESALGVVADWRAHGELRVVSSSYPTSFAVGDSIGPATELHSPASSHEVADSAGSGLLSIQDIGQTAMVAFRAVRSDGSLDPDITEWQLTSSARAWTVSSGPTIGEGNVVRLRSATSNSTPASPGTPASHTTPFVCDAYFTAPIVYSDPTYGALHRGSVSNSCNQLANMGITAAIQQYSTTFGTGINIGPLYYATDVTTYLFTYAWAGCAYTGGTPFGFDTSAIFDAVSLFGVQASGGGRSAIVRNWPCRSHF